jgi:hypothetical protein
MMSATEAQKIMRERMQAIAHTTSLEGLLNYGSIVAQAAPLARLPEPVLAGAR